MMIKCNDFFNKISHKFKIKVVGSGLADLNTEWKCKHVCSPYSRVYFTLDGEAFVKSQTQTIKMQKGKCYFIPAGLEFEYWCEDKLTQLFFHVNVTENCGLDVFGDVKKIATIDVDQSTMQGITQSYTSPTFLSALTTENYLNLAIYRFMDAYGINKLPSKGLSSEIVLAIKYINSHLSAQLSTEEIAREIFISQSSLNKKFKEQMNTTLGKYIDELLFGKAEIMLSKSDLTIKKISEELGFCDQFYFSRKFQSTFGISPLKYRIKAKNSNDV